ncbi:Protein of unknown function [Gryllus bimaculatus]|nr:Protein of unknown function [Gryllus bimaculatus]
MDLTTRPRPVAACGGDGCGGGGGGGVGCVGGKAGARAAKSVFSIRSLVGAGDGEAEEPSIGE